MKFEKYLNFKSHVSLALQNKIKFLCDNMPQYIQEWLDYPELVTPWEFEPIEGRSLPGWIPKQDGGFQISCLIDNGYSIYDETNNPDLVFFRAFVEHGNVIMQCGFNSDAPYYREKYHDLVHSLYMTEADFMTSSIEDIVKALERS